MKQSMKQQKRPFKTIFTILAFLFLLSIIATSFISFLISDVADTTGNVALIPIKGTILVDKGGGFFDEKITSSTKIIENIDKALENPTIKALVFEINTPGGSAVASEEIANAIKKANITSVAWIREIGTSGGYWAASATDHVIASRMSITGSIGVIGSYLELSGLLQRYNITYQRMVSGKYKDLGSPFKPLTTDEEALFQKHINIVHNFFVDEVAANRDLPREKVAEIATGLFYTGVEAQELGLVDELGGKDEVKAYLEKKLNITVDFIEFKEEVSLFELLSGVFSKQSFSLGRGIGASMLDQTKVKQSYSVWT